MQTLTNPLSQKPKTAEILAVPFLLAGVFFAARYLHFLSFGLYEDDLTIIPSAMQMDFPTLLGFITDYIIHLYGHGRPFSDSLIYLFSNLGARLGGFAGMYALGFLICFANILLFYALLRRISTPSLAFIAALAYCLYSADTTQAFLTHSFGLHPSITLLLLAFHSYLSNRKFLAYLLVFIILFSYETPFLVFLAAPLLVGDGWNRRTLWSLLRHSLILAAMLALVFWIRYTSGEGRVGSLTPLDALVTALTHMLQGPLVSLGTFLYRPYQAITGLNLEIAAGIAISFPVFYWLLSRVVFPGSEAVPPLRTHGLSLGSIPLEWQRLLRLAGSGLFMLVMAYPLTFTVRAYTITGRDTRVHAAGVVGASILIACLGTALLWTLQRYKKAAPGGLLLSGLFALLLGYGLLIQRDYTDAWRYQQQFWTGLVPLIPDAGENTIIFFDPRGLPDTRQIGANTWNTTRVLEQLYHFPETWSNPPRVFRLYPQWPDTLIMPISPPKFHINGVTTQSPEPLEQEVLPAQVIFIDSENGHLLRLPGPLIYQTQPIPLKPVSAPILPALQKGLLYRYMILK